MLNLVELGRPGGVPSAARRAGPLVMRAAGIATTSSWSTSPRSTARCRRGGKGLKSARRLGPHPLDGNWGIVEPWVGLGFGLERLLLAREGYPNIERAGRSLSYVDGVRLNI